MTSTPGSRAAQLQVNLAVVQAHYEDAARLHFRSRARAAQYAAIRRHPVPAQRDRAAMDTPDRGTDSPCQPSRRRTGNHVRI